MSLSLIIPDRRVIYRNTFRNAWEAGLGNPYFKGVLTDVAFGCANGRHYGIFNGSTSKINLGCDFIGIKPIAISCWIYLDGWGEGNTGRIITNNKLSYYLGGGGLYLAFNSDGSSSIYSAINSLSLGQWFYVVVTRTSTGLATHYVNGIQSGNANQNSGTPEAGTTNVIIGNNNAQISTFDGRIADLTIWEAA